MQIILWLPLWKSWKISKQILQNNFSKIKDRDDCLDTISL